MNEGTETLARLFEWRDEVPIVPFSGVQFLDFGFNLEAAALRPMKFIERTLRDLGDRKERELIALADEEGANARVLADAKDDDLEYSISHLRALEPFLSKWVPVPVLRQSNERGPGGATRYDPGPSTWARMRVVELGEPDPDTGHTHRVQLALDTTLSSEEQPERYLAPTLSDARNNRAFGFVSAPEQMDWFLRLPESMDGGPPVDLQQWVSDWLQSLFHDFKRAERPGREFNPADLPHMFEHWARYFAYLRLIENCIRIPKLRLVNTISKRDRQKPVDVDLVLDVGNSRICGILIENFPGEQSVELNRAFGLEVRNLSRPEFVYNGLISSRVEFAETRFGEDHFATRSGRRNAFIWPSFVRIGAEALQLVAEEEGTETISGLSSPKRYLWDNTPTTQDWRFHDHNDPNTLPKSVRAGMRFLNESGDVLQQIEEEEEKRLRRRNSSNKTQAIRPRFSRSALFGLMLSEIFAHALVQVNAPATRARRAQSDLPRRLRTIILTLPTATSVQEQAIIRSRAEGALKLVWKLFGVEPDSSSIATVPELIVKWDEASCTQLVYLYSEIVQKFHGQIDRFLALKGQPRPMRPGAEPVPSLRLACIDIGGGTTDLMVTTYWGEANRVLHPDQTFREGFRIAGDELLRKVISVLILPRLQDAIEAAGGQHVAGKLRELFTGNNLQDQQLIQQRRQFSLRALMPIATRIIEEGETLGEAEIRTVRAASVLGLPEEPDQDGEQGRAAPEPHISDSLLRYLEDGAAAVGAHGFRLKDFEISFGREEIDAIARDVFHIVFQNLAEVIEHLGVDVVLLTGRPSRLPSLRAIFEGMLAVPPHRLVSMHDYRAGEWYPFRDPIRQKIGDPKSTVAVGGMLIALSEDRIPNFKVMTGAIQMRSTARYIGEMDTSGQIRDANVLFGDVDLDQARKQGDQTAELQMFAPVYLGSRQLGLERWTTTPLYRLSFADATIARRPMPLKVVLQKSEFDDDLEGQDGKLRREALREAIEIAECEDADRDPLRRDDVRLSLQTLGFEDEYWIDTGVFPV